jgi:hypothetical protein
MRKRRSRKLNTNQVSSSGFAALLDGGGHFVGFAVADANAALAIADNDQSSEAESPATLHDGRTAINLDDVFIELAVAFATRTALAALPAAALATTSTTSSLLTTTLACTALGLGPSSFRLWGLLRLSGLRI